MRKPQHASSSGRVASQTSQLSLVDEQIINSTESTGYISFKLLKAGFTGFKYLFQASVVTKPSATTNLEALVQNEAPKKKSRTKKTKDIETLTVLSDNSLSRSSLTNNSCEDDLKSDVSNNILSEINCQKSNKSKTGLDNLKNTQVSQNEDSSTVLSLSDKFILQSAVPVNENSYPLDNPNKQELPSNSGSLENVLNYGFTDPLVKDYMRFPSVSKIMEDTMSPTSRMVLSKWRKNMIADLGEEGFAKHCTGRLTFV